jgi:hypothetical protein
LIARGGMGQRRTQDGGSGRERANQASASQAWSQRSRSICRVA